MLNESFSCITRTLVEYGKAFVEIVIWKDNTVMISCAQIRSAQQEKNITKRV